MGNVLANRCRGRSECRYKRLQKDRMQGQRTLRTLVADKSLDEVDWQALIQKAEHLQKTEQRELRKRDKKWRRKQRQQSKSLRRKFASDAGVYCINLLSNNCRSSFIGSEEEAHDDGYTIFHPTMAEARTLENTSSSGFDRLTSSSSGEGVPGFPPEAVLNDATPTTKEAIQSLSRLFFTSKDSSTSSIYLLDDALFPPSQEVAARVASIVQSMESIAQSSLTQDIEARVASIIQSMEPAIVSPQPRYFLARKTRPVDRLEPIDMVDLIVKDSSDSDNEDDNSCCIMNEMSSFDVQHDISKLTEDDEPYSNAQLSTAWKGSFHKRMFSKSFAPDGSNQITL